VIEPEALLVLPRLRVQNVNAISSPLTWGFPSPSAFTGFTEALQLRIGAESGLRLSGVGIVCHDFEAQASEPAGKRTKVFHLSRNPVDKDGSTAAIVEEGRAHIEVSLVIGASGGALYSGTPLDALAEQLYAIATSMRLAGGSVFAPARTRQKRERAQLMLWPGAFDEAQRLSKKLARSLLPGFALVSREALLEHHLAELRAADSSVTALDALLDLSRLNVEPPEDGATEGGTSPPAEWRIRWRDGWLVPLPAGYRAISELYPPGHVKNARDRTTEFRFVEGVFTIGEWLSPHRVEDVRALLWVHDVDLTTGLYRCTTPHFSGSPKA
jgi:CRISPR-associated protein Csy2